MRMIGAVLILLLLSFKGGAQGTADRPNDGLVLIVASYNPDTKRMASFITDFENSVAQKGYNYDILIENLACKGLDETQSWKSNLKTIINYHNNNNLKGVVFLGQEAWAAFVALVDNKEVSNNIPFFGCFVSRNGVDISSVITNPAKWHPESIDFHQKADTLGDCGGVFNIYDVKTNIELIRSLYPDIKNIAFLSDFSYGGVSLQAYVKQEMKSYPGLNLILIDSRNHDLDRIPRVVGELPENTAMLIGTWRVDRHGMYFLSSSMSSIISENPNIPVFSLSGAGMGSIALGGYIPKYESNALIIADQIYNYHNKSRDSVYFKNNTCEYVFDKQLLDKFNIKDYQLPKNSRIVDNFEIELIRYRKYTYMAVSIAVVLAIFILILYKLYDKNRKLKNELMEHGKELIQAKEKAEESDRMKTAFLANISHEIRTPLNAIVGFSGLLCTMELDDESKTEFKDVISTNSDMLLKLINDILDISRMESGKIIFNYAEQSVEGVCDMVMSTINHLHKQDVKYIYKSTVGDLSIVTDNERLSQVLINMLTNANKFTDKGSITLTVDADMEAKEVIFSVIDTGCGIPADKRNKVFGRFEKLNECKQGTGLGLSICRQIVTTFGGKIWVDQDYNDGSKFVFTHPFDPTQQ